MRGAVTVKIIHLPWENALYVSPCNAPRRGRPENRYAARLAHSPEMLSNNFLFQNKKAKFEKSREGTVKPDAVLREPSQGSRILRREKSISTTQRGPFLVNIQQIPRSKAQKIQKHEFYLFSKISSHLTNINLPFPVKIATLTGLAYDSCSKGGAPSLLDFKGLPGPTGVPRTVPTRFTYAAILLLRGQRSIVAWYFMFSICFLRASLSIPLSTVGSSVRPGRALLLIYGGDERAAVEHPRTGTKAAQLESTRAMHFSAFHSLVFHTRRGLATLVNGNALYEKCMSHLYYSNLASFFHMK